MLSYNTSVQNSIFMKRRNQNQKISFPFFAGSPHTPRRKRNCKEIFGFGIATEGSVRGASIIRQNPADFVRNTFELRPIHTAKIGNRNQKPKWGRREAPTQTHSRQKFPNPKGFSTLCVARRLPIQFYE
ncbi:MAG: hypothetical protein ACYCZW_03255 [Minisyncoccota bacterium]